nr:MAG: ASC-1 homology (ASCH) domain-containing protein [Candidatus Kentron sp. TUN]
MRSTRIKDQFLKKIESGRKDLEIRVAYPSMRNIRVGELIEFHSRARSTVVKIADIRRYSTFEAMLKKEDACRIVPEYSDDTLLGLLRNIYPKDKEKLGVIALQINIKNL